jgi:hypothetical protein
MASDLVHIGKPGEPAAALQPSGRKLKTMLLFPPEWVPTAPYLALPSLTAVLRQHGHPVIQKDVNIEMYDLFFTDTFLIWVKARMSMQLHALEAKEAAGLLTEQEVDQRPISMCSSWLSKPWKPSALPVAKIFMKPTSWNGPSIPSAR